ncbi:response regulator transcription factor [Nitrosococcus oceani]|uniref:response regulator transcription factor n=1 Tax=Nitrosococcus oceani TaxID=1229 RepID=UPI0004E86BB6|nr:response regulator [Nitrosococcus oceani]KFI22616.1 LuxR family transcriptional regulator [Nitrosococcus oceani]
MATREPMVFIVDDDVTVRNSLGLSLQSVGYRVKVCESAGAFLKVYEPNQPGCIILDVHMPESTGLDLQEYLVSEQIPIPVIFITGQADVPTVVRAVKQGAVDFLLKPFDFETLLRSIQEAIELDQIKRTERAQRDTIEKRLASLTPRERDVLDKVIEGKLNKVIAAELEVSIRTVEIHRARLMAKMKVRRPTELARLVLKLRRSS